MIFQTGIGMIDIALGDWVLVSPECLGPATASGIQSDGYRKVSMTNESNHTQVQIKNSDGSWVWIDAAWVIGVLRPILPA